MADLFQRNKSTISRHIKNIFEENELIKNAVVANFATTASDGKTYNVEYYNLDVIISVGYCVKSLGKIRYEEIEFSKLLKKSKTEFAEYLSHFIDFGAIIIRLQLDTQTILHADVDFVEYEWIG